MRKRRAVVLIAFAVVLLYMVLIPRETPPEYTVERRWIRQTDDVPDPGKWDEDIAAIPFLLDDSFGYVTREGDLLHVERVRHGVAFGGSAYANYGNVVQNLVLQNPVGRIIASLGPTGYPVFRDGRLFTLAEFGTRVTEWDPRGSSVWSRPFPSLITGMEASAGLGVIGLLSGQVVVLDPDGGVDARIVPDGSEVEAIYAVDIDGSTMAIVSGLNPQLLSVYQLLDGGWDRIMVHELEGGFARPVFLELADGHAYVETPEGVSVATAPDWALVDLPVRGRVVGSARLPGLTAFLSRSEFGALLSVVADDGSLIIRKQFPATATWLTSHEDLLVLGVDNAILSVEVPLG